MRPALAHGRVLAALRRGTLVRQPCEVCGAIEVDAHHEDYAKPLDVQWLCRRHHQQLHAGDRQKPIMVRVNITRQELKALRLIALSENKTSQELFAELLRARLEERTV